METKKNEYKIFLASSEELKEDRVAFGDAILELNQSLALQGKHVAFELYKWEYDTISFSERRKQVEYNSNIQDCAIFVMLYWSKVGQYTEEEYDFAYKNFVSNAAKNFPVVLVFKKNKQAPVSQTDIDRQSINNFNDKILKRDGQFKASYNTFEGLKNGFLSEINKLFVKNILNYEKKPYNKTSGNFEYISKATDLDRAKTVLAGNKHKFLCVHGVSGSGKTKFIDNLLYDITEEENVVWVDCAEINPTPKEIAKKLKKIIKFDDISNERKEVLLKKISIDNQDHNFKEEKELVLVNDLTDQIQSSTVGDIADWFTEKSYKKRYIIFDDFDNLISEVGNETRGHWIASNFIQKCLKHPFSPYIIIIYKYKEAEIPSNEIVRDKTTKFVKSSIPDYFNNSIELNYFSVEEINAFVNASYKKESVIQLSDISNITSKNTWLPIQLQLFIGEMNTIYFSIEKVKKFTEEVQSFWKQLNLTSELDKEAKFVNFLSKYLFKRVELEKNDSETRILKRTILASAVLQKYNAGHRAIDKEALLCMMPDLNNDIEKLKRNLSDLETRNILKKFREHLEQNELYNYTFQHDTKLEYAYNGLIDDGFLSKKDRTSFHASAAEFYKNKFVNEKNDELVKANYGAFAVWNYSKMSNFWFEKMTKALPILNKIDRELRTSFNYIDLDNLRRGLIIVNPIKVVIRTQTNNDEAKIFIKQHNSNVAALAEIYRKKNAIRIQINNKEAKIFIKQQASNVADLAETYYQGLDKWSDAKQMAINVYESFKEKKETFDAFLQATHLAAILTFETILEPQDFISIFNTNAEYDDIKVKVKDKLYCIRLIELLLKNYLSIDVKEKVYIGTYTNEEINNFKNRAIIANLCNSLGVFLNRAEKYSDAIKAYKLSARILSSISGQLKNAINKKIEYCKHSHDLISDGKEKQYWKNQENYWVNIENKWDEYIDKDLMCVHSNLSRTLLLSQGVDEAIRYFEKNLITWFGPNPKKINPNHSYSSSQEYNYALMNISYYHFCKGNLSLASSWWDKSQDIPGEEWLKLTKEQMKLVLRAYIEKPIEGESSLHSEFELNCKNFKGIDSRAVLFSNFNNICLEIAKSLYSINDLFVSDKEVFLQMFEFREMDSYILGLFGRLKECRKTADEKDYALAGKVITYTFNRFLEELNSKYLISLDLAPMTPAKNWKSDWQDDVTKHLNDIMTRDSNEISFQPWRPPMLMAGILLMRSKPFAPSDDEIEEIMNETYPEYDAVKA